MPFRCGGHTWPRWPTHAAPPAPCAAARWRCWPSGWPWPARCTPPSAGTSSTSAALEPYTQTSGELVIPRQRDGHFYVRGEINHQPVNFLIDTGASSVAISTPVARAAHLPEGRAITVSTAGGTREARLVHGVPVKAGPLVHNDTSVTVGLDMGAPDGALLGQGARGVLGLAGLFPGLVAKADHLHRGRGRAGVR